SDLAAGLGTLKDDSTSTGSVGFAGRVFPSTKTSFLSMPATLFRVFGSVKAIVRLLSLRVMLLKMSEAPLSQAASGCLMHLTRGPFTQFAFSVTDFKVLLALKAIS